MSFQAMTWAVEQELQAMQKIVLLMLANRTNTDTGICYPSHDRLAKDCGMSKRSVINQIEKLESEGLVQVIRETSGGIKKQNKYRLNLSDTSNKREKNSSARDALPSERDALGVVQEMHLGSARDAHKPVNKPVNKTSNTTTTESHKNNEQKESAKENNSGGGGLDIIFNKNLSRKDVDKANEMLKNINKKDAQSIADVLSAMIEAGEIRKTPIAALGGLMRRYNAGTFDGSTGEHVRNSRKNRQKSIKRTEQIEQVDHSAIMAHLAKLTEQQKQRGL